MVKFNKNDKMVREISDEINAHPSVVRIKNPRHLHIYGVKHDRRIDVVVPRSFPKARQLIDSLRSKGIRAEMGCYWEMAGEYDNKVLGLGYTLRAKHLNECKKVIISAYLTLNNALKFEGDSEESEESPLRRTGTLWRTRLESEDEEEDYDF